MAKRKSEKKILFENDHLRKVDIIGPYLVPGNETIILQALTPVSKLEPIITGNSPYDGGNLILSSDEKSNLTKSCPEVSQIIRQLYGSQNYLNGGQRFCLWIEDKDLPFATSIPGVKDRIEKVKEFRSSAGQVAQSIAKRPHQFRYTHKAKKHLIN